MSGAKHTPGPWSVTDRTDVRSECLELLAGAQHSRYHSREVEANARLIAAAPDLLAALEDMLAGWKYIRQGHGDLYGVGWDRAQINAEAAIAKATGEAP